MVQVADKIYVVTGYRELTDAGPRSPRSVPTSVAVRCSAATDGRRTRVGADDMRGLRPRAEHHHVRPARARPAAPPGDAALRRHRIPRTSSRAWSPTSSGSATSCSIRQGQGQATGIDVVDDYAYPVPVAVICKILGVPLEDEPIFHAWIFDFMAGMDMGPEASDRRGAGPRCRRAGKALPRSRSTWPI